MSADTLARVTTKLRAVARRGLPSLRNVVFSAVDYWPVQSLAEHWIADVPTYCINLRRATRRRANISRQVEGMGLRAFQFVDAVDASTLSYESAAAQNLYDANASRRWHRSGLSINEIACSLSHAECYRRIVAAGQPLSLVIEDDALFRTRRIARIPREAIPTWADIVFFNAFLSETPPRDRLSGTVFNDTSYAGSGAAYLLTLDAARRLLDEAVPVIHAADGLLGRALRWEGAGAHTFREQGSGLRMRSALIYPEAVTNGSTEHYYRSSIR